MSFLSCHILLTRKITLIDKNTLNEKCWMRRLTSYVDIKVDLDFQAQKKFTLFYNWSSIDENFTVKGCD